MLIVATAAITTIAVSHLDLFPPRDYEDCAERAAIDAKSKDALSVLLSGCRTKFAGRRKPGGGYSFYDSCQGRDFDINGPNPTPDELKSVNEQCLAYHEAESIAAAKEEKLEQEKQRAAQEAGAEESRRQQAAQLALQARLWAAVTATQVTPAGFECWTADDCSTYDMKIEVTNSSKEALSRVQIGLAFVPTNGACPSSYAERHILEITLSPGETRGDEIHFVNAALAKKSRACIQVLNVGLAHD